MDYDFEIDGIYYKKISDTEVAVTSDYFKYRRCIHTVFNNSQWSKVATLYAPKRCVDIYKADPLWYPLLLCKYQQGMCNKKRRKA